MYASEKLAEGFGARMLLVPCLFNFITLGFCIETGKLCEHGNCWNTNDLLSNITSAFFYPKRLEVSPRTVKGLFSTGAILVKQNSK
jgi:hypothetical protein